MEDTMTCFPFEKARVVFDATLCFCEQFVNH
jgi:hypothetical protein